MAEEEKVDELDLHDPSLPKGTEVQPLSESKPSQVAVRSPESPAADTSEPSIELILMRAVDRDVPLATLEKLVELKERIDKETAKKAFHAALANFQKNLSVIEKKTPGAKTRSGDEAWRYASLADIQPVIQEPLAKAGLSYSWDSEDIERNGKPAKKTICTITHKLGYSKDSTFTSGIDPGTSVMNELQKEISTTEYGRRQSLKLALGLVIAGEDDDGNAGGGKVADDDTITEEQAKELNDLIGERSKLLKVVLEAYKVEFLADLKATNFQSCKNRIVKYNEGHK